MRKTGNNNGSKYQKSCFGEKLIQFMREKKITEKAFITQTGITEYRLKQYRYCGMPLFIEDAVRLMTGFPEELTVPIIAKMEGIYFPQDTASILLIKNKNHKAGSKASESNQEFYKIFKFAENKAKPQKDFLSVRAAITSYYAIFSEQYGRSNRWTSAIDYPCVIRVLNALRTENNLDLAAETEHHRNTISSHFSGRTKILKFIDAIAYDRICNAGGLFLCMILIYSASEILSDYSIQAILPN